LAVLRTNRNCAVYYQRQNPTRKIDMAALEKRDWVPAHCETLIQDLAQTTAASKTTTIARRIDELIIRNNKIHKEECFNLDPATNAMNPKAEAALAAGLGSRPSLGYPGGKYETGLEAIEEIEVICAELCAEVFEAKYAEIRVASGALSNLYAFMATCQPGDTIIAPPASIGGHVTHHMAGCAGLYGLQTHEAPVDVDGFTIDVDSLRNLARKVKPKLITIGGSLNLFPHPVDKIRIIADEVGAKLLFDAAHQCGIIAGGAWPNPLAQGAHLMTMSTYKSLAGPAGGLIVTNETDIAERLDAIAFPGMTANFDAAKSAALAITMLDWKTHGAAYAKAMVGVSISLAKELEKNGIPVFAKDQGFTSSHQFALEAAAFGGGQTVSRKLRKSGLLACGIGLPIEPVEGDMNGLRIGTPELVRWGLTQEHTKALAHLIMQGLTTNDPHSVAMEVAKMRAQFKTMHFIN
jgi:glycine hydroxymethyltransferase